MNAWLRHTSSLGSQTSAPELAATPEPAPRPCELRGVRYNAIDEAQVVDLVMQRAVSGHGGRIITPNIDILRQVLASEELLQLVASADLVLADGMPVVWALRLQRTPVPERVTGSALGPRLTVSAAKAGVGVFLLGGSPGVAEAAARRLQDQLPDIRIGWHFPPLGFEQDPAQREAIDAALESFGPAVCFVGLGFPKQDLLGAELLDRFPQSWFIGVGATIGFLAGEVSRAPMWMQRLGFEWLHRLILEPRRLAERYVRHDLPFAARLLLDSARTGWRKT
jgi:N-acetylglucosaminyldiphosphoundecaprenol N-acetyl-beta-D-mannosaminyltransferase